MLGREALLDSRGLGASAPARRVLLQPSIYAQGLTTSGDQLVKDNSRWLSKIHTYRDWPPKSDRAKSSRTHGATEEPTKHLQRRRVSTFSGAERDDARPV
jgi:hypothetical protein